MKAVLGLEDGTYVLGEGFGREGVTLGELVFTTPMTGYEEALTDPSYKGQILIFTYPLIGNYGVNDANFQSDGIKPEALVVREKCIHPSHPRFKRSLDAFLTDEKVSGIAEVDTRMLTIKTRTQGTMRSALIVGSDDGEKACEMARTMNPDPLLVEKVTCRQPYEIKGTGPRVVVVDLGVKRYMVNSLVNRNADVVVVPSNTSYQAIMDYKPKAILFTNGPGDPQYAKNAIAVARQAAGQLPVFGICLGHQVIALALGASTYKLKFGHRGANQPVMDVVNKNVYITSQNHGYAVDPASIEGTGLAVTQTNVNDGTVEAMKNDKMRILSVQYHPEACPGPHDTKSYFDILMKMAGGA